MERLTEFATTEAHECLASRHTCAEVAPKIGGKFLQTFTNGILENPLAPFVCEWDAESLNALQVALEDHMGELRQIDGPQSSDDEQLLPRTFFKDAFGGSKNRFSGEKVMSEYGMPKLVTRLRRCYERRGGAADGDNLVTQALQVLIRYQIFLAWRTVLVENTWLRDCIVEEKRGDGKVVSELSSRESGIIVFEPWRHWLNAVELAETGLKMLPELSDISVLSETFVRGMRCRLIEALQDKAPGTFDPQMAVQAKAIVDSVERENAASVSLFRLPLEGGRELTLKTVVVGMNNFETTFTTVPLATAHLALAAKTPERAAGRVLHYVQSFVLWPYDAIEKPITAWHLAQLQMEMGASLRLVQSLAALASHAEAEFLKGAFGRPLRAGDCAPRDHVQDTLQKCADDTALGAALSAAGRPAVSLRLTLAAATDLAKLVGCARLEVTPTQAGRVVVSGLIQRADLNGCHGELVAYQPITDRFLIALDGSKGTISIKRASFCIE